MSDVKLYTFGIGEKTCPSCSEPLPAHELWPNIQYQFCGKPECAEILKATQKGIYIGPNEYKCNGPNCEHFIPFGFYKKRARFLTCSSRCAIRLKWKGTRRLTCGCGCGREFLGNNKKEQCVRSSFHFITASGNLPDDQVRQRILRTILKYCQRIPRRFRLQTLSGPKNAPSGSVYLFQIPAH